MYAKALRMSSALARRLALALAGLVAAASIVLGGAAAGTESSTAANPHLLLGITGNVARFDDQTGQDSSVVQAFLGWGQGLTYGTPFAGLLPTLAPIPLVTLTTDDRNRNETITPGGIADGKGDAYLLALNNAIASWGKGIYIRPLPEMNNFNNFYGGFNANGQARGAAYAPAKYKAAFARIYVILHGGTTDAVNAKLQKLGLPQLQGGGETLSNPFPTLRVIWSPLAVDLPTTAANAANNYFPGSAYVDVFGGDIYVDSVGGGSTAWKGIDALLKSGQSHGKPFSIPEWGLTGVDDPSFVQEMCDFLKSHPVTESVSFYESKPGSRWDMEGKPNSRARYRACMPLAGPFPEWAAANKPGGSARVLALKLTPRPADGAAPLAVTFSVTAKLGVPIQHWLLAFDDGSVTGGDGAPPATVQHTYNSDGVYPATLIVFPFPPFTTANASYYTSADVTVGSGGSVISLTPTPDSGSVPLSVSFRAELDLSGPVTSWEMVFGDGETRQGTGAPPHFSGHTFKKGGDFNVLFIVNQSGGRRFMTLTPISAGGGGTLPAPKGTKTGTVLVNGKPYDGGTIPFNSNVDVTNGSITLTTTGGKMKLFGEGGATAAFLLQKGSDKGKPIFLLKLTGGDFSKCPKRKTSGVSASSATKKKPVRSLWGDGKGKFQTKGRFSSATVRGTKWLTADQCDGTLTQVARGVVEVKDVKLKKTVSVKAGKSYFATG
jgi:PKD repeat protein